MADGPSDTSPEAARVQLELLRSAGTTRRLKLAMDLSQMVIDLSRRAIRRANPNASQRELDLLFVETNYGKDMARWLRRQMEKRQGPGASD